MILNLHGECPSTTHPTQLPADDGSTRQREATTILNAESHFLPTLLSLHQMFPKLQIVLEHLTTAAAVEAVMSCGPTVAGTITAHHLHITVDDITKPHCYCKPVAKLPSDRTALLYAATSGNPKFFFGSDSAPHSVQAKGLDGSGKVAAGVFTQMNTVSLVLDAFERAVDEGILAEERVTPTIVDGFMGAFGRQFYGLEGDHDRFLIAEGGPGQKLKIAKRLKTDMGDVEVIPFHAGEQTWAVKWDKKGRMGVLFW